MLILFFTTFIYSVVSASKDSIYNAKAELKNINYDVSQIEMVNWNQYGEDYISAEDPMLIIYNINEYVHDVTIKGALNIDSDEVQVFCTSSPNEWFSEEQSSYVPYYISGNTTRIYIDSYVSSLRIDIVPNAGVELSYNGIEINDRSPVIKITDIAQLCILPVSAAGVILFLILFNHRIRPYFTTFVKYVPLLKNLISRDLKVKYRRSLLGFLWSILNPLLMALVISIVFSKFFRFQIEYYATYYLLGALIFNFVSEATSSSMTSVIYAAGLIKKVYIPKYIFPLEKCAFAFINMLFSGVAVAVVMLIQGVAFHPTVFLAIVPMFLAFGFAYGIGLILAAVTVIFRDIEHLYSVCITIWMYLTPIIYPEELLISNGMNIVMKLNPMYYYVHSIRNVALYGVIPSATDNIMCLTFTVLSLITGICVFKSLQDKIIFKI